MSRSDIDDLTQLAAAEGEAVRRDFKQTVLSGVALTVPFFITVLVLAWALQTVAGVLEPLGDASATVAPVGDPSPVVLQTFAALLVFGLILLVGIAAQHGPDTHISSRIDALMEDLPGVGSIYTSVERMSDVIVEGDTEGFESVRVVEFPQEESYAIAFLTADTPPAIEDAVDQDDLVTVFVPLAPNPVMGGHLVNLPPDRVHDADLTVEEGMQAIMTTGMAIDPEAVDGRVGGGAADESSIESR